MSLLDDIKLWSPAVVKRFLIENNFDEDEASHLEAEEVDGAALVALLDEDDVTKVTNLLKIKMGKFMILRFRSPHYKCIL